MGTSRVENGDIDWQQLGGNLELTPNSGEGTQLGGNFELPPNLTHLPATFRFIVISTIFVVTGIFALSTS